MKRKVIVMGGKTYVISLPAPWIKKYGIKKSDELDVVEEGNKVIVGTGKNVNYSSTKVDITGLSTSLIYRSVFAAYITGADEITIYFDKSTKEQAYHVAQTLIGCAITNESKAFLVIKDVGGTATEFDNILRRIFLMIYSLAQEGFETLLSKNNGCLILLKQKSYEINYSINFCLRYLNRRGYTNVRKGFMLYTTLKYLEILGDVYDDIYQGVIKTKMAPGKEVLALLKEVITMYGTYQELFYKFEKERMVNLLDSRDTLLRKLSLCAGKLTSNEPYILDKIFTLIIMTFNLLEAKLEDIS